LEEAGHDVAGEPGGGVEAGGGGVGGEVVRAADTLRGGEAAAEPVADDGADRLGFRGGVAPLLAGLAGAAVADRDGPVVEQVAAEGDGVMPVVVLLGVVGL
jgi:hypothetical protein